MAGSPLKDEPDYAHPRLGYKVLHVSGQPWYMVELAGENITGGSLFLLQSMADPNKWCLAMVLGLTLKTVSEGDETHMRDVFDQAQQAIRMWQETHGARTVSPAAGPRNP